ncbi:MAG: hypothetical protein GX995_10815 [Clostridiales bacterium]|nr:hypothetical protein [Clostridiales bacterium]
MSDYKVVFHIDELDKWKLLLSNVSNLLNGINGKTYNVMVIANGEAVKYYDLTKDLAPNIASIENLGNKGVVFIACNNSLLANNIDKSDIISLIKVVPAGVLELVERQIEGYAYIRP